MWLYDLWMSSDHSTQCLFTLPWSTRCYTAGWGGRPKAGLWVFRFQSKYVLNLSTSKAWKFKWTFQSSDSNLRPIVWQTVVMTATLLAYGAKIPPFKLFLIFQLFLHTPQHVIFNSRTWATFFHSIQNSRNLWLILHIKVSLNNLRSLYKHHAIN